MENLTNRRLMIIVLVAALVVVLALMLSLVLNFNLIQNLVMSWVLTTLYSLFAFYMIDPIKSTNFVRPIYVERKIITPVENKTIEIVEKPIIRNIPIQVPVENRTIEVVDRPVYIDKPVIKRIYVTRRKLHIPKFTYLASSETKRFHKTSCRLSKLIKRRNKVHSNSQASLKRKHFKACKICIKH